MGDYDTAHETNASSTWHPELSSGGRGRGRHVCAATTHSVHDSLYSTNVEEAGRIRLCGIPTERPGWLSKTGKIETTCNNAI
jgi:hypothetical protein